MTKYFRLPQLILLKQKYICRLFNRKMKWHCMHDGVFVGGEIFSFSITYPSQTKIYLSPNKWKYATTSFNRYGIYWRRITFVTKKIMFCDKNVCLQWAKIIRANANEIGASFLHTKFCFRLLYFWEKLKQTTKLIFCHLWVKFKKIK